MSRFALSSAWGIIGFPLLFAFQNCGKVGDAVQINSDSGAQLVALDGTTTDGSTSGTVVQPDGTTTGDGTTSNDNLVECDLGGPSEKIASGSSTSLVALHSNSSTTRICMSENACLNLINAYADVRGCTLAAGAPTTATASAQCTQVFPGSKGTCHNAETLADTDIVNILNDMDASP